MSIWSTPSFTEPGAVRLGSVRSDSTRAASWVAERLGKRPGWGSMEILYILMCKTWTVLLMCWSKRAPCLLKNAHGFAPLYSLKVKGPLPFALPYSSHTQNNLPISSTLFSQSQRAPLICSPISPHIFALPYFSHTPNAHPICATLSSQIQRVPPNCSAIFLGS